MVASAVTKIWRDSLDGPPSIGRVYQPEPANERTQAASIGWCQPPQGSDFQQIPANDTGAHPEIGATKTKKPIVPKRRVVTSTESDTDGLLKSYEFWMGIVAGAGCVLAIKTVFAVQSPFGVGWY